MEANNVHYRHILLYYFKRGKRAAETYKKICRVYGDDALTERVCQKWFAKFRSGDFDVNNTPRSGRPIEIDSSVVKAIVDANPFQSVRGIATALNVSHTSVENHLHQLGYVFRLNAWVPGHGSTEANLATRTSGNDLLTMDKLEYRAVIRFLHLKGESPTEIKAELNAMYGDASPSLTTIKTWAAEFKRNQTSTCNDERFKRPKTKAEMPKDMPPDQKKRKMYNVLQMATAIKLVREKKIGYLKAAKTFGVPKSTLQRLVNNKVSDENVAAATKLGGKPILSEKLEDELIAYCQHMESLFYGITKTDIRQMAYQLAVRNNITKILCKSESQLFGRDWLQRFMRRHKDKLFTRKLLSARAYRLKRNDVSKFFDAIDDLCLRYKFPAERVFNVDVMSLAIRQPTIYNTLQVISCKGEKRVNALSTTERNLLITAVICINAESAFVPPMIIFPRQNTSQRLMAGAPPESISACHPSGWIQTNLFTQWFEHFITKVKSNEESPVMLILNGHYSYTKNIDVIELAKKHHVHLISLPPHSADKMQPLNRTFMDTLVAHYSKEIQNWNDTNDKSLKPCDIVKLFGQAYLKTQNDVNAVKDFKDTGIFPPNKNIFGDYFVASDHESTENVQQIDQQEGHIKMEFFDESESKADTVLPNKNVDADFIAANHGNVQLYQGHVKGFCDKLAAGPFTASDIVPSFDNDVNITIKKEEDNFTSMWLPESDFFTK